MPRPPYRWLLGYLLHHSLAPQLSQYQGRLAARLGQGARAHPHIGPCCTNALSVGYRLAPNDPGQGAGSKHTTLAAIPTSSERAAAAIPQAGHRPPTPPQGRFCSRPIPRLSTHARPTTPRPPAVHSPAPLHRGGATPSLDHLPGLWGPEARRRSPRWSPCRPIVARPGGLLAGGGEGHAPMLLLPHVPCIARQHRSSRSPAFSSGRLYPPRGGDLGGIGAGRARGWVTRPCRSPVLASGGATPPPTYSLTPAARYVSLSGSGGPLTHTTYMTDRHNRNAA